MYSWLYRVQRKEWFIISFSPTWKDPTLRLVNDAAPFPKNRVSQIFPILFSCVFFLKIFQVCSIIFYELDIISQTHLKKFKINETLGYIYTREKKSGNTFFGKRCGSPRVTWRSGKSLVFWNFLFWIFELEALNKTSGFVFLRS